MDEEFACPNGHPFPALYAVRCEECDAAVACVPLSVELRLREQIIAIRNAAIRYGVNDEVGAAIAHAELVAGTTR